MNKDLFSAEVWEQAWREDPKAMGTRMRRSGVDIASSFGAKAEAFNREAFSEEGRRRSERIIGWIEGQGVHLAGMTVLDIGAASGGFTVPFAQRGAEVTAVEPSLPLVELLGANTAALGGGQPDTHIVAQPFEKIDVAAEGWEQAYDLVFASMCPAVVDWASVEKVLSCAKQFCYISLMAGGRVHSLLEEVLPLLGHQSNVTAEHPDMGYLLHLLYLKGYAYESIVTNEMKSTDMSPEAATGEVLGLLKHQGAAMDEGSERIVRGYIRDTYGDGPVTIKQGGRFGKVLIRLQDTQMYSRH